MAGLVGAAAQRLRGVWFGGGVTGFGFAALVSHLEGLFVLAVSAVKMSVMRAGELLARNLYDNKTDPIPINLT